MRGRWIHRITWSRTYILVSFKLCTYCWAHSGPTTGVEPICVLWGTYWQLQPLAARCDDQSEKLLFVRKNLLYQNWKVCSLAWNKSKGTEVFSQLSFRSSDNWLLLPRWFCAKKTKKQNPLVCQVEALWFVKEKHLLTVELITSSDTHQRSSAYSEISSIAQSPWKGCIIGFISPNPRHKHHITTLSSSVGAYLKSSPVLNLIYGTKAPPNWKIFNDPQRERKKVKKVNQSNEEMLRTNKAQMVFQTSLQSLLHCLGTHPSALTIKCCPLRKHQSVTRSAVTAH